MGIPTEKDEEKLERLKKKEDKRLRGWEVECSLLPSMGKQGEKKKVDW